MFITTDLLHMRHEEWHSHHFMKVLLWNYECSLFVPSPCSRRNPSFFIMSGKKSHDRLTIFGYFCVCVKLRAGSVGMYSAWLLSGRISQYINRACTAFIYLPMSFTSDMVQAISQVPNETVEQKQLRTSLCICREEWRKKNQNYDCRNCMLFSEPIIPQCKCKVKFQEKRVEQGT